MWTVQEVTHREELKTKNNNHLVDVKNDLQVTYWSYSYLSGSKSQTSHAGDGFHRQIKQTFV